MAQTVAPDAESVKKAAAGTAVTVSARSAESVLISGSAPSPSLAEAGAAAKPSSTGSFSVAAIPEPGVYATALGLAVLGVVGLRRWKRRSASV